MIGVAFAPGDRAPLAAVGHVAGGLLGVDMVGGGATCQGCGFPLVPVPGGEHSCRTAWCDLAQA